MIEDKDLKQAKDYSQGQKQAAYSVLGEIVNLLAPFTEDMRIIGGWVPSLLYPNQEHVGSIDVDVLLDQTKIKKRESYATIKELLTKSGYSQRPQKYFTFTKTVMIDGISYDVDVDFLSGKYGGISGSFSKHVDGIKTLPATGGNFAFEFPPQSVKIEYRRTDGALDSGHVNVVAVIPYIVMKTAALGRGKPKDAYDIYFCLTHYEGGIRALAKDFEPYKDTGLVRDMCKKLGEKFASPQHAGPMDITAFMDLHDEDEIQRVKQDAFQRVNYLLESLC